MIISNVCPYVLGPLNSQIQCLCGFLRFFARFWREKPQTWARVRRLDGAIAIEEFTLDHRHSDSFQGTVTSSKTGVLAPLVALRTSQRRGNQRSCIAKCQPRARQPVGRLQNDPLTRTPDVNVSVIRLQARLGCGRSDTDVTGVGDDHPLLISSHESE